jgi:hypothetical protein
MGEWTVLGCRLCPCIRVALIAQSQGQLMEREKVDVQERQAGLKDEKLTHTGQQMSGGNNDGGGTEGIVVPEPAHILDQRRLEIGVERTGRDAEHRYSLTVIR